MHMLFVCTGNTCRSPMAEALARHYIAEQGLEWTVGSAGLYAMPGQSMAHYSTDALIRRHIVAGNHASKPLTPELVEQADWIFTMTEGHRRDLVGQFPEALEKTHTLLGFLQDGDDVDVADPFGGSAEIYEACAASLDEAIRVLIDRLREAEQA